MVNKKVNCKNILCQGKWSLKNMRGHCHLTRERYSIFPGLGIKEIHVQKLVPGRKKGNYCEFPMRGEGLIRGD
jgi:hypothetical protein